MSTSSDALLAALAGCPPSEVQRVGEAALLELGGDSRRSTSDVALPHTSDLVSELRLPPPTSKRGLRLAHALRAHCCAAASARGRWAEAEEHAKQARGALLQLRSLPGAPSLAWQETCALHNALVCGLERYELHRATAWTRLRRRDAPTHKNSQDA